MRPLNITAVFKKLKSFHSLYDDACNNKAEMLGLSVSKIKNKKITRSV
jgi:hypothetical protein